MPFTILIYSYRKPGTTPAAFKSHYESSHVPLIQSLTGTHFPQSHKRFYIQRSEDAGANNNNTDYPATVLVGTQQDFQYDAFAELIFEDAVKFQTFMGIVSQGEAKEALARDEEMFLDRARLTAVVVGETLVTRGDLQARDQQGFGIARSCPDTRLALSPCIVLAFT